MQAAAKSKRAPSGASAPLLPQPVVTARSGNVTGKGETAGPDWQRRMLTLFACVGILAAYLGVRTVVMFFLPAGAGPVDTPTPSPVEEKQKTIWPHILCSIPVSSYSNTPMIVDQCRSTRKWESVAGMSALDDGGCYLNKTTSEIDCSRKESCHGGQQQIHKWSSLHNNLTYDCASKCEGTLRVNCCKMCQSLRHTEVDFKFIHCAGCEKEALGKIVNKNTADCSLDSRGFFSCEAKDACKVVPSVKHATVTHSLSCSITPCGVCSTPQLRGKCCSICLASLCNSPKDRQVCTGCSTADLAQARHKQTDLLEMRADV